MTELTQSQKVINILSQSLHLRFNEATDAAAGISEDEHNRRHYLWVSGMLAGIAFAMDYPRLAVQAGKLARTDEKTREFALPFVVDALARHMGDEMWPLTPSEKKLAALADAVRDHDPKYFVNPLGVRVQFSTDGVLSWVDKQQGEYPLETWLDTYTWDDSETL